MILISPKHLAAKKAKKWGYDYWDGDRRICYGGYKYIPGRWKSVAENFIDFMTSNPEIKYWILDVEKVFCSMK